MLDKTNTGRAGADEAVDRSKPSYSAPRRRSKRDGQLSIGPHTSGAITSDERALGIGETHTPPSPLVATNSVTGAHDSCGAHTSGLLGDGALFDGGAHIPHEVHGKHLPAVEPLNLGADGAQQLTEPHHARSPVIIEIVQLWRMRQRWHRAEKSLTLQGKAICRSFCGGDKDKANKLFEGIVEGSASDPVLAIAVAPFLDAIATFEPQRKAIEKRLRKLAHELPIWPWVKGTKGFGDLNLAALIGECGDIGTYRNPSCLWKRMGMAVIDGGRQRKVADAEAALVHGYNPARRAVAFLLGECLIKATGPYKAVYDERKVLENAREGMTPIHAHRRAARYMVKRVLRDLWIEWRHTHARSGKHAIL